MFDTCETSQVVIEQSETSSIGIFKPISPKSDINIADTGLLKPNFPLTHDVSYLRASLKNKIEEDIRLEFAPELKNDDALTSYVYENFSAGKSLEEQVDEMFELVNDVPIKNTVWG